VFPDRRKPDEKRSRAIGKTFEIIFYRIRISKDYLDFQLVDVGQSNL
jgi:hypothetical protein